MSEKKNPMETSESHNKPLTGSIELDPNRIPEFKKRLDNADLVREIIDRKNDEIRFTEGTGNWRLQG